MAQGELGAGGGAQLEADEADHVLAEVEGPVAGFRFGDGFGRDVADGADRAGDLAFEGAGVFLADFGGLPAMVIGAGDIPPLDFEAGVIVFTLHEIG